ncbi:MAG: hypothetical protein A2W93_10810 [Bacteroidetes bacterium GWF2_43_63]|nr:MAG: hypothetical protein A2W94_00330 [Bacteroidetes bacterium GWE2_42_42]OFY56404.1 MAG: hypothetical protein A2W93_10810 [Bacteroidetes bacterium GWF2_43_63]HBG72032.1 hypothetical protein [Bacteroidales bacterium]HCB63014.1 hypothetical protein [Bacteroidales bacterium]HCY23233.1 hypothetical protein [Bacteroidales bacterium]
MKTSLFILMLSIFFMISCGGSSKDKQNGTDSTSNDTVAPTETIVLNHFYNDIARFVAGMPVSDSSVLKEYTEKTEWKNYSADIDKSWAEFQKNKLGAMQPWIDKELNGINETTSDVFYPFSGPDFVYMYTFLPKAENYYMVALEPVGIIPDITKIENSMPSFFAALNNAIRDNLNLSFFITKSMKVQMNNEQIKGTIPVLLFFMARLNLHIQNISPATISKDGKQVLSETEVLDKTGKKFSNGVEITFLRPGENKLNKLYYYSVSIRNDGFASMPEAETFLKSLPTNMTTIVKSSSYCMHEDKYDKIREIVLSHSKFLIQDDSGVPCRFFNKNDWNFGYYGIYTRPIPVFSHFYQEDLKKSWPQNASKLSFRFGYNEESNIFVATRKK